MRFEELWLWFQWFQWFLFFFLQYYHITSAGSIESLVVPTNTSFVNLTGRMDYLFGATTATDQPSGGSSSSSNARAAAADDDAALNAAVEDAAGMEQRRLMLALHAERERLASEQLAINAKWDSAEAEKKRLQEHLMTTTRTLEDTRTQLADQERFLRAQHAAEARRRKDLLNQMGEVKLRDVNLVHEAEMDAAVNERQKKERELLLMAQSVDAARLRQVSAEREAEDMHGESIEARARAFDAQRRLDAVEHERSRSAADALRARAAADAESDAKTAALAEIDTLRAQLAEAEHRAARADPTAAANVANAAALALYREKLGPAPTEPDHVSQLVAVDGVESRLAAASANSDLLGDVAAMASRRERVKMKHDLAMMETMTRGLEDEIMRVQADGQALATSLQRDLTTQTQLKETAQAEAAKFRDQARALAHALSKLKEASYELESGMTAATTRAKERLRAVIDAILPAFDHHANLQLSGEETDEVFDATIADLGAATSALRHGRDELLQEIKEANDASRSATVALEQTRDQASVTNAKLTERIQGQADDIRALQEGKVLDRAEFARERSELEEEITRLKALADKVEDNAMRAAEKDEDRLKRAREELRVAQQTNTRLQAELAGYRGGGGGVGARGENGKPPGGAAAGTEENCAAAAADSPADDAEPLPGWKDLQELKSELTSAKKCADEANARAAAAESALEAANARSMEAARRAADRVAARTVAGDVLEGAALTDVQALRDELQGVTERLLLVTEDNTRLKTEKVQADLALDHAKNALETRGLSRTGLASRSDEFGGVGLGVVVGGGGGGGGGVMMGGGTGGAGEAAKLRLQVQQLERDKAALTARAEAAEKRHKNLLQEKRLYVGD